MEHERAGGLGIVDALDRRADIAARRIAGGRNGDRDGGFAGDLDFRATDVTVRAAPEGPHKVALDPRNDDLGLRIAEARIELENSGTVFGQHQSGVENTRVGRAPTGE